MEYMPDTDWPCTTARVIDVIGDSWSLLLLRETLQGVRRYDDFRRSLGIARNTLSDRLRKLVDAGILSTRLYQENPPRNEYLLTPKGRDLFGVFAAMMTWGDKWLDDENGPPIVMRHRSCGAQHVLAESVCSSCGEPLGVDSTDFRLGTGFPAEIADRPDIRLRFGRSDPLVEQSADNG